MNTKRFGLSFVVVFAFIFLFNWVLHGHVLQRLYLENRNIWRPPDEMQTYFCWLLLGQAVQAFFITLIFVKGYQNRGVAEGIRYGLLIGFLFVGAALISYATQLLPKKLILGWAAGWLVEYLLVGVLLAL